MRAGTDEAAIREQAYYFWEQEGRPEGRDEEFWMRAVVSITQPEQLQTLTETPPARAKVKSASEDRGKPAPAPAKRKKK